MQSEVVYEDISIKLLDIKFGYKRYKKNIKHRTAVLLS